MKNKISSQFECYQNDLLLHSMSNFTHQISKVLDVLQPKSLCEVGIEGGLFTNYLLEYAQKNGAKYIGIEPHIDVHLKDLITGKKQQVVEDLSLNVLKNVDADVIFLDGDHNYYTLYYELKQIFSENRTSFVFLHDISWPWRNRDLYYDVDTIPSEYVHPYESERGLKLGEKKTVPYGFRSLGHYSFAKEERGEKNGLLPAIEDFIASETERTFAYYELFAIFGLGLLFEPSRLTREQNAYLKFVKKSFDFLNPLIINMEANRLELLYEYWEQIEHINLLNKDKEHLHNVVERKNVLIEQKDDAINLQNQRLQKCLEEKKQNETLSKQLSAELNSIVTSKAWKLVLYFRKIRDKIKNYFLGNT